jgi:hypothetical protein
MSEPYLQPGVQVPRWFVWVGSIAIVFHLGAIGVNTLAAPSGPWPSGDGGEMVPAPLLAQRSSSVVSDYLRPMRQSFVYHSHANVIPATPGIYVEFRLKDEQGNEIKRVNLPDDNANGWVRHRQAMLTIIFGTDQRIAPRQSEMIYAPGQEPPKVQIWDMQKGELRLKEIEENRVQLDRPVYGPTEWMFLFARSYSRYLCEIHGAAKAEVIRHYQEPIRPFVLTEEVPARAFSDIVSNFGEFSR